MLQIRQATIGDYRTVYKLVRQAFAQSKISDGQEQDWIIAQRSTACYVPELELVAERDGQIVGHVLLTERKVITPDGYHTALYLSPLCVKPDCRKLGIGSALVTEAFARAANLGYQATFLVGDPKYYSRFGFRPVTQFGIQNCSQIPDVYVQAMELKPGALGEMQGELHLTA